MPYNYPFSVPSGETIISESSGSSSLGTISVPFKGVYTDNIVINNSIGLPGTINAGVISGTIISGNSIYQNGIMVLDSINSISGPTITVSGVGSVVVSNSGSTIIVSGSATGDVTGPASSTNYNVALWNGTTGQLLQNSNLNYSGGTLHQSTGDLTISNPVNLILSPSIAVKIGAPTLPTLANTYDIGSFTDGFADLYIDSVVAPSGQAYLVIGNNNSGGTIQFSADTSTSFNAVSGGILPPSSGVNSIGASGNPFASVYTNNVIGNNISGNAIFVSGTQIIPGNYQPTGNYVVSGSSTTLNILNVTTLSGTTISGGSIYQNGNQVLDPTSTLILNIEASGATAKSKNDSQDILISELQASGATAASNISTLQTEMGQVQASGTTAASNISTLISELATVSGTASAAIQTVTSSGAGTSLVNGKIGTTEFINSLSGLGTITLFGPTNGVISISGASTGLPNNVVLSGSSTTLNVLNVTVLSGTTISGVSIYQNGHQVLDPTSTLILNIETSGATAASNISTLQTEMGQVQASGTTAASNISTLISELATVSGTASAAIQNATNLGTGVNLFSSKSATNLQFNSVSGAGNVSASLIGNVVYFSGNTSGLQPAGNYVVSGSSTILNVLDVTELSGTTINSDSIVSKQIDTPFIQPHLNGNSLIIDAATYGGSVNVSGTTLNLYANGSLNLVSSNYLNITSLGLNSDFSSFRFNLPIDAAVISGTTISGNNIIALNEIFSPLISGTTISGNSIYQNGIHVLDSINSIVGPTVTIVGAGNTSITTAGSTITVSGSTSGGGIGAPSFTTNTGLAIWSGTTGSGLLNASGATINASGTLNTLKYTLGSGPDLSLIPIVGNQSVITTYWGMQLVGNRQSGVDYTPISVGAAGSASVIIPNQQIIGVGLLIQNIAGQTADSQQWRNASSGVMSRVDNNGQFFSPLFSGTVFSGGSYTVENSISLGSGATFTPVISGANTGGVTLGSSSLPLSGVYAKTFIGDVSMLNFVVDGGGSVISSGSAGFIEVPYNALPVSWNFLGNISGSLSLDVRRTNYTNWSGAGYSTTTSIVDTQKPVIASGTKSQNTNLNLWSGINTGDILEFYVDSAPTLITRATLSLKLQKLS